jgi:hypothetical protein
MVTNASLILLEAWAAGSAGQDDLNLIQNHLNLLTCTQQTAPSLRHTLATRLETALQQVRTPVRTSIKLPNASPAQTTSDIVNRWSYPAIMSSRPNGRGGSARGHPLGGHHPHAHAHAHAHAHSRGSSGRATPSASGFLFMDHAPNLGILPDLPTVDVEAAETSVAEWPPFLLNLFGEPDPNESTS